MQSVLIPKITQRRIRFTIRIRSAIGVKTQLIIINLGFNPQQRIRNGIIATT